VGHLPWSGGRAEGVRQCAVVGHSGPQPRQVTGEDDLDFLRTHVGDDLLAHCVQSSYVRAHEQGRGHGELEAHNTRTLERLCAAVDARPKDWTAFQKHAVEFHLRNAATWANEATSQDLATQVDPDFQHGPTALAAPA